MLAGGRSRRMGHDKAASVLAGRPLFEHMEEKLRGLGLLVHVAGAAPGITASGTPVHADARPGCGPMSGLETALRWSQAGQVLVVGIDLPLLSTTLLAGLLARAQATGALATVPQVMGRPEPLCAVYRRELSPAVTRLLRAETFKMMYGVEQAVAEAGGRLDMFAVETVAAAGGLTLERPAVWEFLNCNTPQDLALAERLLARDADRTCPSKP